LYVVTAVTWAAYIVYAKDRTDRLRWDPIPLAGGIVLITALMTLPAALWAGVPSVPGRFSLGLIIYTAVLNTALPFVFYQQGLRYLTAGSSAVVLVLEIVVALAVSAAFLGEAISPVAAAGAVMMLVSFGLVSGLELGLKRP
jgi:drug/metabolite transporter (DMT)-like permease